MTHAVEHDLHHRALVGVAATGFGHARQRQTVARAVAVGLIAANGERPRRAGADRRECHCGIARPGIVGDQFGHDYGIVTACRQVGQRRRRHRGRGGGWMIARCGHPAEQAQQNEWQQHQTCQRQKGRRIVSGLR
ncbi:hypothetical protein [Qipengyuania sp.]|uniref:hypothetical protein n=1 Tax=Qipengyuania sp. TaxID=2004515 RepID=UPI003D0B60B3